MTAAKPDATESAKVHHNDHSDTAQAVTAQQQEHGGVIQRTDKLRKSRTDKIYADLSNRLVPSRQVPLRRTATKHDETMSSE
jgi:hypothetical protein